VCLSLSASEVKTDRHRPQIISVGLPFLTVELASRDALGGARPDAAHFAKTFPCDDAMRSISNARCARRRKAMRFAGAVVSSRRQRVVRRSRHRQRDRRAAALLADLDPLKDGD